jgi:hypothetical protein
MWLTKYRGHHLISTLYYPLKLQVGVIEKSGAKSPHENLYVASRGEVCSGRCDRATAIGHSVHVARAVQGGLGKATRATLWPLFKYGEAQFGTGCALFRFVRNCAQNLVPD